MRITSGLTDDAVLAALGQRLARLRLDRNLTQQQLADEAGVSRHTVLRLEGGHSVTAVALVRLLRSLELLDGLELLVPQPLPSPIEQLDREGAARQRASGSRSERSDEPSDAWRWGTP